MRLILRDARGRERTHSQDASESGGTTIIQTFNATGTYTINFTSVNAGTVTIEYLSQITGTGTYIPNQPYFDIDNFSVSYQTTTTTTTTVCSVWDGGYRYGFNGKEKDFEVFENCIAYEARIFDSRIGRFFSSDPREMEYPWQSTYTYYKNSPISIIDYLGKGKEDKVDNKTNNNNESNLSQSNLKLKNNDGGGYGDKDVTLIRSLRWKIKAIINFNTPKKEIFIKVNHKTIDGLNLKGKYNWQPIKYRHEKGNGGTTPSAPTVGSSINVPPNGGTLVPPGGVIQGAGLQLVNLNEDNLPGATPPLLNGTTVVLNTNFVVAAAPSVAAAPGTAGTLTIMYATNLATGVAPFSDNITDAFVLTNTSTGTTQLTTGQVLVGNTVVTVPANVGDQYNLVITPGNIGVNGDRFFIIIIFTIP